MAQGGALTAVALSYDDEGSGHPLLFLHGGACDRSFWGPQVLHFRNRYRLVLPDLRGHGRSPSARRGLLGGELCQRRRGPGRFVGDRRSHGDRSQPGRPGGLRAAGPPPGRRRTGRGPRLPTLAPSPRSRRLCRDGRSPPRRVSPRTPAGVRGRRKRRRSPGLHAHIAAAQDATDLDCFISLSGHAFANSYDDLLAECDVPALLVTATIPNDMDQLGHLCPQLHVGKVVGSGHFLELEVPDQVNAMLDRFLQLTDRGGGLVAGGPGARAASHDPGDAWTEGWPWSRVHLVESARPLPCASPRMGRGRSFTPAGAPRRPRPSRPASEPPVAGQRSCWATSLRARQPSMSY